MMRRYVFSTLLLCMGCSEMAEQHGLESAKAAWARIEALGGHGVWESDMVVVSLKGTGISDDDLSLFSEFPYVQILDISLNLLTDDSIKHLERLSSLESLIVCDTQISDRALAAFRA